MTIDRTTRRAASGGRQFGTAATTGFAGRFLTGTGFGFGFGRSARRPRRIRLLRRTR